MYSLKPSLAFNCKMEINEIITVIESWGKSLPVPVLIFLFGSCVRNKADSAKDIDLAVVILKDMAESDRIQFWIDNHSRWEIELTDKIGKQVDLELYEPGVTKKLRDYLIESSKLIYAP